MVPGLIANHCNYAFINTCINLTIHGNKATAIREIDGGSETLETQLPLVIGAQKGLVEESDLKIPNMRGIMSARTKPLEIITPSSLETLTEDLSFEKPASKGAITLVDEANIDQLIELLHKEAKVL
jgi:electron transfer flavoprotein beta subunit